MCWQWGSKMNYRSLLCTRYPFPFPPPPPHPPSPQTQLFSISYSCMHAFFYRYSLNGETCHTIITLVWISTSKTSTCSSIMHVLCWSIPMLLISSGLCVCMRACMHVCVRECAHACVCGLCFILIVTYLAGIRW